MFCGKPGMLTRECEGQYDKEHKFCVKICCFRERCFWKSGLKK